MHSSRMVSLYAILLFLFPLPTSVSLAGIYTPRVCVQSPQATNSIAGGNATGWTSPILPTLKRVASPALFDPFRVEPLGNRVPVALPPAIESVAFGDNWRCEAAQARERQAPAWRVYPDQSLSGEYAPGWSLALPGLALPRAGKVPLKTLARILELEDQRSTGGSELTVLLRASAVVVRERAALALGRIGDRSATSPLIETLKNDKVARVRLMAAFALGEIEDPAAIAELIAHARNTNELIGVRARAVEALGKITAGQSEDERLRVSTALIALLPTASAKLTTGPQMMALFNITALMRLRAQVSVAPLARLLSSPDGHIRAWAGNALFRLRVDTKAALPELIKASSDRDWMVRANAARALGVAGDSQGFDSLTNLLSDPDERVVVSAVRGLASLKESKAVDPLIASGEARFKLLESDPSALNTLLEIAAALGIYADKRAVPLLQRMRKQSGPGGHIEVEIALAKTSAEDFFGGLDSLDLRDWKRTANIASGLGEIKSEDSKARLSELYEAIEKNEIDLRAVPAILRAMSNVKIVNLNEKLEVQLKSKDSEVQATASQLLGKTVSNPTPPKVPPDSDFYTRMARLAGSRRFAEIDTTKGRITVELFTEDAPFTVENFVELAQRHYFDGVTFHRVVPNFVIQGGDPTGTGEGGPGYRIRCEINLKPYTRGTIGMALDGKDTGGSQFFATHAPQPHLDGGYTVFGKVVSGMDVVDRIVRGDVITRVTIRETTRRDVAGSEFKLEHAAL